MAHLYSSVCAFCGHEHDMASAVMKKGEGIVEPHMGPGDATLCMACGHFNIVAADGMLRIPTDAETEEINGDEKAQLLYESWKDVKATRQ